MRTLRVASLHSMVLLSAALGGLALGGLALGCQAPEGDPAASTSGLTPSRCTIAADNSSIVCTQQALVLDGRSVLYQTPLGAPPLSGWPMVIVFQGSGFGPSTMWHWSTLDPVGTIFGGRNQVLLVKNLLDAGFAVISPAADLASLVWDTNLPPWDLVWQPAPDNQFMNDLFTAIDGGAFGPLSQTRWYATGVSSGGYMTSRMAVSYQNRFRALAIESGSYATCGGPLCIIPSLPSNHPPTLFLHGGADLLVPVITALAYRDRLSAMGIATRAVVDPFFMHGWIPAAPSEISSWFQTH